MNTSTSNYKRLLQDGLWRDNPALVMLLGLCPLLAVSNSLINGLALGIATLVTVCITNVVVSLCRNCENTDLRLDHCDDRYGHRVSGTCFFSWLTSIAGYFFTIDRDQLPDTG